MHSTNFIETAQKQLQFYKTLGEKTMAQLGDEQLFHQFNPESNSISILVNHMVGNMLSRWTDFLTSDGEKEWRQRDNEFIEKYNTRIELIADWEKGWKSVFDALGTINDSNFDELVYIRNQGHTIIEAVTRQLCHYSYHVGQIVFYGKQLRDDAWTSLSIPRNKSAGYNKEWFDKPKTKRHFTDEV